WWDRPSASNRSRRISGATGKGLTHRICPLLERTTSRSLRPIDSVPLWIQRSVSVSRALGGGLSFNPPTISAAATRSSPLDWRASSATIRGARARYRFGRSRDTSIQPLVWSDWRIRYTAGYWTPRSWLTFWAVATPFWSRLVYA